MREFQGLKTSITGIVESTEAVVDISSALKDHEETKRSLSKVGPTTIISNQTPVLQSESHGNVLFMQAADLVPCSKSVKLSKHLTLLAEASYLEPSPL